MWTASKRASIGDMNTKQRRNIAGAAGKRNGKSRTAIYQNLHDFLSRFSMGYSNEYGEGIISGRRIC